MKPKKPCKNCGHAKTWHSFGFIPIPAVRFAFTMPVSACQYYPCVRYDFNE